MYTNIISDASAETKWRALLHLVVHYVNNIYQKELVFVAPSSGVLIQILTAHFQSTEHINSF